MIAAAPPLSSGRPPTLPTGESLDGPAGPLGWWDDTYPDLTVWANSLVGPPDLFGKSLRSQYGTLTIRGLAVEEGRVNGRATWK